MRPEQQCNVQVDPDLAENQKLTPRSPAERGDAEPTTINMDDCWTINIKAPASLSVERGEADDEGFSVRVIVRYLTDFAR